MSKKILIYGGSSLISKELINIFVKENYSFVIFCRKAEVFFNNISSLNIEKNKFDVFEADLLDLQKNFELISKIEKKLEGVIWVAGFTGDPTKEFENAELTENNIKINFLHPALIINKLLSKINIDEKGFLAVISSVAGLRGRAKNIFYGSAKSALISFLSGLRQKFNGKLNILTIIPGYMSTKPFKENAPQLLITSPEKAAQIIVRAIKSKKEIVYINSLWRIIMFTIKLIPEKIFKRLKF
tara:strand:+ start:1759 stop:2484 length:726 start_codon:yes stop_codon:yes gene_type:complete